MAYKVDMYCGDSTACAARHAESSQQHSCTQAQPCCATCKACLLPVMMPDIRITSPGDAGSTDAFASMCPDGAAAVGLGEEGLGLDTPRASGGLGAACGCTGCCNPAAAAAGVCAGADAAPTCRNEQEELLQRYFGSNFNCTVCGLREGHAQ